MTKIISNRFSDIDKDYRLSALSNYFESAFTGNKYVKGQDFFYINIHYSEKIIAQEKISGRVVAKNAKCYEPITIESEKTGRKILGTGEATGEEYNINKMPEFSKDYDDNYLIRLEKDIINEVHIHRDVFKKEIEKLAEELYIIVYTNLYPNQAIPRGFKKIYKTINKLSWFKRNALKQKAYKEIIRSILERENIEMAKTKRRFSELNEKEQSERLQKQKEKAENSRFWNEKAKILKDKRREESKQVIKPYERLTNLRDMDSDGNVRKPETRYESHT